MKSFSCYLIILVFMAGCSASHVVSFYNPATEHDTYKTFIVKGTYDREKLSDEHRTLDSLMNHQLSDELLALGYLESSLPDIYVSYSIDLNATSEARSQRNYYSRYDNPYYGYSPYPYSIRTTNYKEGVVIVEIKNRNNMMVWQGSRDIKVKNKVETNKLLLEVISEIAQSFKPSS